MGPELVGRKQPNAREYCIFCIFRVISRYAWGYDVMLCLVSGFMVVCDTLHRWISPSSSINSVILFFYAVLRREERATAAGSD